MIISPLFMLTQIFGGECGMGAYRKSGGNYFCEHELSFKVERRDGAAYKISVNCPNSRHSRVFWTSDIDGDGTRNINKNIAVAGRLTGMKFQKTNEFLSALGSTISSERAYDKRSTHINHLLHYGRYSSSSHVFTSRNSVEDIDFVYIYRFITFVIGSVAHLDID